MVKKKPRRRSKGSRQFLDSTNWMSFAGTLHLEYVSQGKAPPLDVSQRLRLINVFPSDSLGRFL